MIETANHFRCIDVIIENAKAVLTEKFIKELHLILKNGISDSRKDGFAVGDYKKLPNEVGGMETVLPEEAAYKMKALLTEYYAREEKTFEDILDFHVKFERIHPFQDDGVIIGARLEKPSKINGFALLSPIFLSHAGWREDGAVHINTYYTESQMGLCA